MSLSSALMFICTVSFISFLILALEHVFHALFCYMRQRRRIIAPPGPWRLPFLGNLHQLLLCKPLLPHQALTQLAKKHGPLMRLHMGSRLALFVSTGAMAKAFFQANDQHFASRPAFEFCDRLLYGQQNGVAFSIYGPRWRKMRRICTLELFTTKRIISFQKVLEEELALLVDDVNLLCQHSIDGSVQMNIAHLAHLMVSNMIGRLVLGKRMCDTFVNGESLLDMFKKANDAIVPAMTDFLPFLGPLLDFRSRNKMKYTHHHIDAFWTVILRDRRKCREVQAPRIGSTAAPRDFLDVLLSNQEVSELGDDNIKATLMDILGAGSETSAITIEWAMAELLKSPHCLRKLEGELDTVCPTMEVLQISPSSSSIYTRPISSSLWASRNVLSSLTAPSSSASASPSVSSCANSIPYSCIAEASYLKAVVKETLRLHPPVPLLIPRGASTNCSVNNKGTSWSCEFGEFAFVDNLMLFVNAWAIGRDADAWERPHTFQPERFDDATSSSNWSTTEFGMLPFGIGRRRCPGMALALCILELTLATFVRAFHWELPIPNKLILEGQPDYMREKSGNAGTRKADPLVAIVRPRASALALALAANL